MGNSNTEAPKTCYYYVDDEDKQRLLYVCCARINLDVSFGRTSYLLSDLEPLVKEAFDATGHLYLWEENNITMIEWDKSIDELLDFVTENPLFTVDKSLPRLVKNPLSQVSPLEKIRGHKFDIPGIEEVVNQIEGDNTSPNVTETKGCNACKEIQMLNGMHRNPCSNSIYCYSTFKTLTFTPIQQLPYV